MQKLKLQLIEKINKLQALHYEANTHKTGINGIIQKYFCRKNV